MEDVFQKIPVDDAELRYRKKLFAEDRNSFLNVDIKCTVCGSKLNWMVFSKKQVMIHPVLEVLLCEGCLIAFDSGEWPGCCAWCGGNSDRLISCKKCPMSFCEKCIRTNFGERDVLDAFLGRPNEWECYICDLEELWLLRAVCDAAKNFTQDLVEADKTMRENESSDCAICLETFEQIKYLSCNHAFHKDCLEETITKSRSCPVCRSSYAANRSTI